MRIINYHRNDIPVKLGLSHKGTSQTENEGFPFYVKVIERPFDYIHNSMEQQKFIAYLRQSTKKQEISGLGIEAQRDIILRYLQKSPDAEYVETESGKKTDRPVLREALKHCRKIGATLIVAKLDRLSRNVAFTSKLLESDVEIVFCDFPQANKLVLHIIAAIAEYEAGLISTRTKQSLQAKKARGVTLGKPENLMSNLIENIRKSNETNHRKALANPQNKRAVAYLRTLTDRHLSLRKMADILNEEGFTAPQGGKFTARQVSILLKRYKLK